MFSLPGEKIAFAGIDGSNPYQLLESRIDDSVEMETMNAGMPELTPVHRLAFRYRTKNQRSQYISGQLAGEEVYNETLFDLCKRYEDSHRRDYNSYKQALAEEEFLSQDWTALTRRQRIAVILHKPMLTYLGRFVAGVSAVLAVGSVIALMLETLPEFNPTLNTDNSTVFSLIEGLVTAYFTVETVAGIASHPVRLQYLRSPTFAVDLISCLPLYLTFFLGTFLPNAAAVTDTIRVFRLFRLSKYVGTLRPVATLATAVRRTVSDLSGPLFFLVTCCIIAATTLYYAQRGEWNEARGAYMTPDCQCEASPRSVNGSGVCKDIVVKDIADGVPLMTWWGFITFITVGFGDVVPQCPGGRVIASLCMVISSILVAMPVAVLGESFTNEASKLNDEAASLKAKLAATTAKEHQRVLQLAAARRLHEIRPSKLILITKRAGLPVHGQPADMVKNLYRLLGIEPKSHQQPSRPRDLHAPAPPAVLTLSESLIEYVRLRIPFEIVDLQTPPEDLVALIDTFFERIFGWWVRSPARHLAHRLECGDISAAQRITPLVTSTEYTIGVDVPGIVPADVILPHVPQLSDGEQRVTFGPRMATLKIVQRFGVLVYVLKPTATFRPLVNGRSIDSAVELRDRDVVNFGTDDLPLMYTFARFDEFAHGHSASKSVDIDLPTRMWSSRLSVESLLPGPRPQPPYPGAFAREEPPLSGLTSREMQANFFL
jgi:hypothetical protein